MSDAAPLALDPSPAPERSWWTRTLTGRSLIVALIAGPLLLAFAADVTLCASAGLFDTPCPGCGLTRATYLGLTGDLAGAFRVHPLWFVLTPLWVGAMLNLTLRFWLHGGRPRTPPPARRQRLGKIINSALILLIVMMLGVWTARFFGALGGPVPVGKHAVDHYHPLQNPEAGKLKR